MSKKKASAAPAPSTAARPGTSQPGSAKAASAYTVEAALADLRAAIEAGDQLAAEVRTATLLATPTVSGQRRPEAERFVASLISAAARWDNAAAAAALCRLLMVFGPGSVKKMASGALRELTAGGVYPPDWVNDIGKPVPGQAWRRRDVYGDDEAIAVTYHYGETKFAALAMIDLTMVPVAVTVGIAADPSTLIASLEGNSPLERWEEITPAQARRHLDAPLIRAAIGGLGELSSTSVSFLPTVRTYVRRLPEADADASGAVTYTTADRAAAVDDFLASQHAAQEGSAAAAPLDAQTLRFWAQALTGYSGRVPGEPPAQVGPRKLLALLGHVANTFTLTDEQRAGMRPAVTAWTTWAASRQGLDKEATAHLLATLPKALDGFAGSYDDSRSAVSRAYLRDVASPAADVTHLASVVTRRSMAVAFPGIDEAGQPAIDVADPAARASAVAAEFASCQLDAAQTRDELIGEATRLVEQLWSGEPAATWDTVRRLASEGRSRHDAIHALMKSR